MKVVLEAAVEKVVAKLDRKTFMEAMPVAADRVLLGGMHDRMAALMRRRMGETVAELLARDDVLGKVEELRGITSRTQHPCTHQVLPPPGTN